MPIRLRKAQEIVLKFPDHIFRASSDGERKIGLGTRLRGGPGPGGGGGASGDESKPISHMPDLQLLSF